MRISDWSSDVCSSDLVGNREECQKQQRRRQAGGGAASRASPAPRQAEGGRRAAPLPHREPPPPDRTGLVLRRGIRRRLPVQQAGPAASRSEEHTSELQSLMRISYAVFCLKTKTNTIQQNNISKQVT